MSGRHGWNGNLPTRWLADMTMRSLSAEAFSLHCWAIIASMANESDGRLGDLRAVRFIAGSMLSASGAETAAAELIDTGVWLLDSGGIHWVSNWAESQVTANEIADKRQRWRNNKRPSTVESPVDSKQEAPVDSPVDSNVEAAADSSADSPETPPHLQVGRQVGRAVRTEQVSSTTCWDCDEPAMPGSDFCSGCAEDERVRLELEGASR